LREALLLSSWSGIGRQELRKLLRNMTPKHALDVLEREIPDGRPPEDEIEMMQDASRKHSIRSLVYGSEGYPGILEDIPDPPAVLFYIGDMAEFLSRPPIAVIGSRVCTAYGRRVTRLLAGDFVRAGAAVVSGLARGIDSEAHEGALAGGGLTAAVMGSGLDVIYPPEHGDLARRICRSGVLISEYPPGTEPARYRFPERNRLISGLSLGVVVVEAGKRSGTMITVGTALDQGREVFAVPGEVTRALSMGTNMLLRDGAGVVISAGDVLEPLGIKPQEGGTAAQEINGLPEESGRILGLLREEELHFDQICRLSGITPPRLQSMLLQMELQGLLRQLPGKFYALR